MTISTSGFASLVRETARAKGFPNISTIKVPHPVGGLDPEKIRTKADDSFEQLLEILTIPSKKG